LVRRGFIERRGEVIVDASASVTLVEASGKRIVIDTGSPAECDKLLFDLKAVGLSPKEVDIVVNTHLHIDHCGCNEIFENAVVYAHQLESPPIGNVRISGSITLFPGVEIVHTPGHTAGSVTVFVMAEKRYAMCGDAIPTKANYDSHVPPFIAWDKGLAMKSMDAILASADVIVPGHDAPFEVRRKK
jgi:glyoxylase-like metal-dependent hydrolase (beta-lactamase superfamily II)